MQTMKPSKRVSVVVPSFNGRHLLQRHLHHVFQVLSDGDEVVIVDDASSDDTLSWLKLTYSLKSATPSAPQEIYPSFYFPNMLKLTFGILYGKVPVKEGWGRLVVISLSKNSRFAAAANVGVALASNPLIFLLNNDVSPRADVLTHLLPYFDSDDVFGVGCLEYDVAMVSDQDLVGPLNPETIRDATVSGKNTLSFKRGLFVHARSADQTTGTTAWISGGSGMFVRKTWIALGGFDKRFYPAYWEDIDLSFRARKIGLAVLFDQNAIVFHQHEATNQSVFGARNIARMSWRNAAAFVLKNGSLMQKLQFYVWQPYWLWKRFTHAPAEK